jgi:hypothetical protein
MLALVGCNQSAKVNELITATGGPASFAILQHPTQVQAFTIKDESPHRYPTAADYPITAGPILLHPALSTNISEILCSQKTYYQGEDAKGCMPLFGVRLRFSLGTNAVDVLLCMSCNILMFMPEGKEAQVKDFDPGRPAIVRFLKTVFPDDKVIQLLKEDKATSRN